MRFLVFVVACLSQTTCAAASAAPGPQGGRAPAAKYRWDLTEVFENDHAWHKAADSLEADLAKYDELVGSIVTSPESLVGFLPGLFRRMERFMNLSYYAELRVIENARDPEAIRMRQRADTVRSLFERKTHFVEDEIKAVGRERIEKLLAGEKRLAPFSMYLRDTLRLGKHLLGADGEQLLASFDPIVRAPSAIYRVFVNAEMPWPTATLSDGTELKLDFTGFARGRALRNRSDRLIAVQGFYKGWLRFEQTIGSVLSARLQAEASVTATRGYPSTLARYLHRDALPPKMIGSLVKTTNNNLATLHRFLRLHGRILNVSDLRFEDLYITPISSTAEYRVCPTRSTETPKSCLQP